MTPRKLKNYLWLGTFAATYGCYVWAVVRLLEPVPRVILHSATPQASAQFSPDGKYFISSTVNDEPNEYCISPLCVWDVQSGRKAAELSLPPLKRDLHSRSASQLIEDLTFTSDGKRMAFLAREGESLRLAVYDLPSKLIFEAIGKYPRAINPTFAFSHNGNDLAVLSGGLVTLFKLSVNGNRTIQTGSNWDVFGSALKRSRRPIPKLLVPQLLTGLHFSKCGKILLCSNPALPEFVNWSSFQSCSVWDIQSGRCLETVASLWDSAANDYLVAGEGADDIRISPDGMSLTVEKETGNKIVSLGGGIEGSNFAVKNFDVASLWRSRNVEHRFEGKRHVSVWNVPRDNSGTHFNPSRISSFNDYARWEITENGSKQIFNESIVDIDLTADGRYAAMIQPILTSNESVAAIVTWRDFVSDRTQLLRSIPTGEGDDHESQAVSISISPGGSAVALSFRNYFAPTGTLRAGFSRVSSFAKSLTGYDLEAFLFENGRPRVEVWNGHNSELLSVISNHFGIALSPDSQTLVTQDEENQIYFCDVPPRRDVLPATGIAVIPTVVTMAVIAVLFALLRKIVDRIRRSAISHESAIAND